LTYYKFLEQYTEECEDYGYDPKPSHGAKHEEKEKFEDEEDYDNYHGSQGPEVIYVKKESTERKPIGFIRSKFKPKLQVSLYFKKNRGRKKNI